jgi:transcriptional regulator with GAF, ATPase, and Fis domain
MTSHHRKAQEIPRSTEIDTDVLCCPRCQSRLRRVLVSADMESFPKTLGILPSAPTEAIGAVIENGGDTLRLEAIEKRTILTAVRKAGNKKTLAARMLGIGRTTLFRKLKDYDFDDDISGFARNTKDREGLAGNGLKRSSKQ